ncbi:MAG: hypothetical protein ABIL47_07425 [candidate division WOR-3 bacterium]
MNIIDEKLKAQYPNVIFDATTVIIEAFVSVSENTPIGTLVKYVNGQFSIVNLTNDVPVGVIIEPNPNGKSKILIRGLYRGQWYWFNQNINSYDYYPSRFIMNVIRIE